MNNYIYKIALEKHRDQLFQSIFFHNVIEYLTDLDHIPMDEEYIQIISDCCGFADRYKDELVDEIMKPDLDINGVNYTHAQLEEILEKAWKYDDLSK